MIITLKGKKMETTLQVVVIAVLIVGIVLAIGKHDSEKRQPN